MSRPILTSKAPALKDGARCVSLGCKIPLAKLEPL